MPSRARSLDVFIMNITGSTRLTGLFGYPVSHTISPKMQNAAFRYLGLDIIYLPFCISPDKLEMAVRSLIPLGFIGINVTIPHKQAVMKYLDEITPSAKIIGAVNTILIKNNKLIGYNTDGIGFVKSLKEDLKYDLKNKKMFLLGAGGAGRAIAVQSALSGAKIIFIADKATNRVKKLVSDVPGSKAKLVKMGEQLRDVIRESDIIVNATPVGMHKKDPICIPKAFIPEGRLVYDVIYNPKKTKLLKEVRGCKTANGLGMLLYQGVSAFSIWTGKEAPVEVMRKAIDSVVRRS